MYTIHCSCGIAHSVAGTDAGRSIPCSCGQSVDIPRLSDLRKMAGEAVISPELEIELKLGDKRLPEGHQCTACGFATERIGWIDIQCEQVTTKNPSSRDSCLWVLLFGVIGYFLVREFRSRFGNDERQVGRNVNFRLPLRICPSCQDDSDRPANRELLERVPLYQRLLKKYPHSTIGKKLIQS